MERRAQAVQEGSANTISGEEFLASLQKRFPSPRCPDPEVTAIWVAESRRRLDAIRSGEVETIPGDVVFEKLRQRFDG
ncbi:MAG: addiction module protein [Candidatus Hydrogenedentota bacterium]